MNETTLRIDHLAYPCFEVEQTHRFYTQVMDLTLAHAVSGTSEAWGGRPFLLLCFAIGSAHVLDFFALDGMTRPPDDGLPKDIRHLALAVASREQFAAWPDRLRAHGVAFWTEEHGGAHDSIYFSDPNGVMIELTHWNVARVGDEPRAIGVMREWMAARGERAR